MVRVKQRTIISRRSRHDLDVMFYRRFDPDMLFNKALVLDYVTKNANVLKVDLEDAYREFDEPIDDHYFASLRAELRFTELHQFESFFAVLIAIFQDKPHWMYLTEYQTKEIKTAIQQFIEGDIKGLTNGLLDNEGYFLAQAIYSTGVPGDTELEGRWDENLAMIGWLVRRMAQRYLDGTDYNAYKHGLRLMTGYHAIQISAQNDGGTAGVPVFGVSTDDSISYLQVEDIGEGGQTLREVTKHVNPAESFAYLTLMHQMLQTAVCTRRARLTGEQDSFTVKEFTGIDRDQISKLGDNNRVFTITI